MHVKSVFESSMAEQRYSTLSQGGDVQGKWGLFKEMRQNRIFGIDCVFYVFTCDHVYTTP